MSLAGPKAQPARQKLADRATLSQVSTKHGRVGHTGAHNSATHAGVLVSKVSVAASDDFRVHKGPNSDEKGDQDPNLIGQGRLRAPGPLSFRKMGPKLSGLQTDSRMFLTAIFASKKWGE
jgi:hypothetical protein